MNPYWYALYMWSLFHNPQPVYYAPPPVPVYRPYVVPTRPPVQWSATMPISTPSTFDASQWPPGYVPNPTQAGMTYNNINSGCRVVQQGLTVCS